MRYVISVLNVATTICLATDTKILRNSELMPFHLRESTMLALKKTKSLFSSEYQKNIAECLVYFTQYFP